MSHLAKEKTQIARKKRYSVFASENFKNFFWVFLQKIYMTVKLLAE